MTETYELWDVEAGNVVGEFATQDEGLAVVQTLVESFGREYAADLTLSRRREGEPSQVIAEGDRLIEMLQRTA